MKVYYRLTVFLLYALGLAGITLADAPSASYIFPPGGRRGTTVQFRVGAHYLHGGSPFEMCGEGIEASSHIKEIETIWFEGPMIFKPVSQKPENYPKDHLGTVKIATDAMPGVRYWRLWTSQGVTSGRQFIVGDLPEFVEEEIDGRALPVHVPLPVTINGRIFPREDVDIWSFDAVAGQSITCEVYAARIGSPLDSRLEVQGPDGRRIAENVDHFGSDSFLRFTAPQTGMYQLLIHDINYAGLQHYVYRLTVTADAYIDHVFPLGGQIGSTVPFELTGQQIPAEPVDVELSTQPQRVGPRIHHFRLGSSFSNPVLIDFGDLEEHIEVEPNDEPSTTGPIALPTVFNGRIDQPGDVDHWTVTAKKEQKVDIDLATARFFSPLDAVLTILDASGKQLSQLGSSEDNPVEAKTSFSFPEDGTYVLQIRDVVPTRGGPEFAYRLRISDPVPRPDFVLRLPGDSITLFRGDEAKFKITVDRRGGFEGEIELVVEGLPVGVEVNGTQIPADKSETELVFKAEDNAPIRVAHLTVAGTAPFGDTKLNRQAKLPGPVGTEDRDDVLLVIALKTPFKVTGTEFLSSYAARGTIFHRPFVLHRQGFQGPLEVRLADRQIRHQQGVTGSVLIVPPEATEFVYSIQVPFLLEMNRTGRTLIMTVGEVEDAEGVKHKVSYTSDVAEDQIMTFTAPSILNLRLDVNTVRATPGATCDVGVQVMRGVLKPAPVKIELITPKHFHGVEADTSTIVAEETKANLTVRFGDLLSPFNMPAVVRATTFQDGSPVIAEAKLELVNDWEAEVNETGLASIRESVRADQPDRAVNSSP